MKRLRRQISLHTSFEAQNDPDWMLLVAAVMASAMMQAGHSFCQRVHQTNHQWAPSSSVWASVTFPVLWSWDRT